MSISELIYSKNQNNIPPDLRVDPDDYPQLIESAKSLGTDIRIAYAEALNEKEEEEREIDLYFLNRAKDYVELNEQVETSTKLLLDLSSFLSTFQSDLSAVSGHISELQSRSKTIEQRLESRKAVERSLHPLLHSIVISPSLINLIVNTEVGDPWIPAVIILDAKLGAIRSGPRIENRKTLDEVAEALRIKAAQKILAHLLSILKPFTLSITNSLTELQSTKLLPLKPLFDFLRRHSARQAHEFQKAYINTIKWYFETGFRRYIRGLEKIRLRLNLKYEPIGIVSASAEAALALLSKRTPVAVESVTSTIPAVTHSQIEGPDIVLAYEGSDKSVRPPPEALFRSLALVLLDNSQTEFNFITTFFGQHSDLPILPNRSPNLTKSNSNSNLNLNSGTTTPTNSTQINSRESSIAGDIKFERRDSMDYFNTGENIYGTGRSESENGRRSSMGGSGISKEEREEKLRKTMIEGVWRNIMEPALEYSQNFVNALIDPISPSPISLLSMIRLNDSIISLSSCSPLESYLTTIRLLLYPIFIKNLNLEIESLKKINGTFPLSTSSVGGVFSSKSSSTGSGTGVGSNVKDSVVRIIGIRFIELFNAVVVLTSELDEEMVFSSLIRLRNEFDKLLLYQSNKIIEKSKRLAFLSINYEEILIGLNLIQSINFKIQQFILHYKELNRKILLEMKS